MNLAILSHGSDSKQYGQEGLENHDSDNHDGNEDKKSPTGANDKKEENEVAT